LWFQSGEEEREREREREVYLQSIDDWRSVSSTPLPGDTASGRSWPSIWRRVLYPHSSFGLVARLSEEERRRWEGAAADRIFRICLDPVRLFWSVRSGFWVSFWTRSDRTDRWYFGKKFKNQQKIIILNFRPLRAYFEEESATWTPIVIHQWRAICRARILGTIVLNSRRIPEFGHPLHRNPGTKIGVPDPKSCKICSPLPPPRRWRERERERSLLTINRWLKVGKYNTTFGWRMCVCVCVYT
jgi:hypothetical protein